jgi:uracil phosphoribosyltransferase
MVKLARAITLGVAALALSAASLSFAADKVSLRLNWYLGGLHVPFYYGKEKGYYAAEGIDLTINEGRGSANTVQVVAAGSDTFGLADSSSVILTASKGADVKSVMSLLNTTGYSVVTLAEANNKKQKYLEGKKVAVTPVLRAGVGMLDGVLSLISSARVGFIGMYRDEETLQPVQYFVKLPADMNERDAIVLDPMLATGNSSAAAIEVVKEAGARTVTLVCLVAVQEGIDRVHRDHPDVHIVCAAIDRELDERGFIVPGLGDAGDRLYGTK